MAVCHFRGPVPEWLCFAFRLPDRPGGGSSHISALLAREPRVAGPRKAQYAGQNVLQEAIRERHLRVYQREERLYLPAHA